MAAHIPEEIIELATAAEEARVLLTPLEEQLDRLEALQQTHPTPALHRMAKTVHAMCFLLRLESIIISQDIGALTRYRQPNLSGIELQLAIGDLFGSYGVKKPMHFRVRAMAEDLTEAIPFYSKSSKYPEMVRLIQETKSQTHAQENDYYLVLEAAKKPFDEQHVKGFAAIRTYQLAVNIDFAALRKTTTAIIDLLQPIRELARLMLPINARLLAQFTPQSTPNTE